MTVYMASPSPRPKIFCKFLSHNISRRNQSFFSFRYISWCLVHDSGSEEHLEHLPFVRNVVPSRSPPLFNMFPTRYRSRLFRGFSLLSSFLRWKRLSGCGWAVDGPWSVGKLEGCEMRSIILGLITALQLGREDKNRRRRKSETFEPTRFVLRLSGSWRHRSVGIPPPLFNSPRVAFVNSQSEITFFPPNLIKSSDSVKAMSVINREMGRVTQMTYRRGDKNHLNGHCNVQWRQTVEM